MRGANPGGAGSGEALASANPQWNPTEKELLLLVESQAELESYEGLFERKKEEINKNALNQALVSLCWNAKSSGPAHDVLNFLITRNADPNTNRGPSGSTPLMICARKGFSDIMSFLLKSDKIKVNAVDSQGRSALIYAVDVDSGQNLNIVSSLLENKANINVSDQQGRTPLAIAVERAHADTVLLLLEHGADWSVKTSKGDDLFSHAADMRYEIIKELLEKRRAKDQANSGKVDSKGSIVSLISESNQLSKDSKAAKRGSESSTSPARPTSGSKERQDSIPEHEDNDNGSIGSDDNLSIQAKLSDTMSGHKDLGSIDIDASSRKDHNPAKNKMPLGGLKPGIAINQIHKQKFIDLQDRNKQGHSHGIEPKSHPKQAYDTADAPRHDEGQSSARHVAAVQSAHAAQQQLNQQAMAHSGRDGYQGGNQLGQSDPNMPPGQYYQGQYVAPQQKGGKERPSKQQQQPPMPIPPAEAGNGGNELLNRLRENNKGGQIPPHNQIMPPRNE